MPRKQRSKRGSWAERPTQTMEKNLVAVCRCLQHDGFLYLDRDEGSGDFDYDSAPPAPWIVVHFQDKLDDASEDLENVHPNVVPLSDGAKVNDSNATSPGVLQRIRDKLVAIRFLSLLARCPEFSWRGNPQFWHHLLVTICGVLDNKGVFSQEPHNAKQAPFAPALDASGECGMPAFKLIFTEIKLTKETMELCEQAFSTDPKDEIFASVNQRVKNLLSVFRVHIPQQPRVVQIVLRFDRCQFVENSSMLGVQAVLAVASNEKVTSQGVSSVCFVAQSLGLRELTLSKRDLDQLAQTVASHSLHNLVLNGVFTTREPQRFGLAFGSLMSSCFGILPLGRATNAVDDTPRPLPRLDLDWNELDSSQLAALFSAVHAGNTHRYGLRQLSLRSFHGMSSWLWLAFGLFHPSSKSQITHLDLTSCVLRLEDIELMRSLLHSPDYAMLLTQKNLERTARRPPRALGHDSCHEWVLLPAGTRLEVPRRRDKKHSRTQTNEVLQLKTERWCEALQKGKKWACVLVPGHGKLWVKSSFIIDTKSCSQYNSEQQALPHACKLEELTMVSVQTSRTLQISEDGDICSPDDVQLVDLVLSEWVRTVGLTLRTLHLRNNPLTDAFLGVVIESCPQLKHLDVEGCGLTSTMSIITAFKDGRCQLETLKAGQNEISATNQLHLLRVLALEAARSLRVLHLEENVPIGNRLFPLLTSSLKANKTLRELKITMDTRQESALTLQYTIDKNHHDEYLGNEDLLLKKRLALLSVPTTKTLPIAVVKIIFEFAKVEIYRQILWE